MSLYNLIFGKNPNTAKILEALSLTEADIERFRDCFILYEARKVVIYARTGGGNREAYPNAALTSHPLYLYDEDDDSDCTYASYYFTMPDSLAELIEK